MERSYHMVTLVVVNNCFGIGKPYRTVAQSGVHLEMPYRAVVPNGILHGDWPFETAVPSGPFFMSVRHGYLGLGLQ